ncbi:MAG TPA: hypothetical protein VFF30_19375 [Nitrososphaerales archaeon]|nr:hypothetical protein [Nitrososphaerales archaeon]
MSFKTSFASGLGNMAQAGLASTTTLFWWSVANAIIAAIYVILYLWEA